MIFGLSAFVLLMMLVGMLFCFAVLAGIVWLVARWLNTRQKPMMPDAPRQQDPYYRHEQGSHPSRQPSETYHEDGRQYDSSQPKDEYEQPQVQYPQEVPPQQ